MKKIILASALIVWVLNSCTKSEIKIKDHNKGDDCVVTINPIGEISTSENPITKASNNNIYLVQVTDISDNNIIYAMGIYNDLNLISVNLHKGSTYKFAISAIYGISNFDSIIFRGNYFQFDDRDISSFDFSFDIGLYNPQTSSPLWSSSCYSDFYTDGWQPYKSNRIVMRKKFSWGYAIDPSEDKLLRIVLNQLYYNYLGKLYIGSRNFNSSSYRQVIYDTERGRMIGITGADNNNQEWKGIYIKDLKFVDIEKAIILGVKNSTIASDWFYGQSTFTPSGETEIVDMNFKRVGYKLKYELSGVTDGEVTVTIKTPSPDNKILIQNTTNTTTYSGEEIFVPFYDIANVFSNATNYQENVVVSISWLRGIGITQDLGSKTIQVKRNNLNRVRIELGNSDQGAAMSMTTEAESMDTETTDITVE